MQFGKETAPQRDRIVYPCERDRFRGGIANGRLALQTEERRPSPPPDPPSLLSTSWGYVSTLLLGKIRASQIRGGRRCAEASVIRAEHSYARNRRRC